MAGKRRVNAFSPQVDGLEVRDVPTQLGMAHVGAIHAAKNTGAQVFPITQLAGQWNSVFHATVEGANLMPGLPASTTSTVETKLVGNKLDTRITGGSMPTGWAYSISGNRNGQLTYSMTDPYNPSKVLNVPGRRIGVASWGFYTDITIPGGDDKIQVVFTMVNRNSYAVATSLLTAQGYVPLYVVSNNRIQAS